jgi:germination protein M
VSLLADLYFPAGDALKPERRELAVTRQPRDQVRKVVEALLAGPTAPGLVRPYPKEVTLGSVLLGDDGVAYVDLQWANHDDPPAAGSDAEMQMVYSIVDSIALNIPQAQQVVLLWNGAQRQTFSGHLDTSQPLVPLPDLAR